ncbi:MAG TPA: hypothetical protein PKD64_12600 [Pirellulaceae bacterium]|nr:hypothetical protein [Pirellulaceae bacterium]HMO93027.1 hypothetical protein [Pirellulaceae bacterium]HMP69657.1 hypothetical protein [Pirellulaceae bacterium]
MIAWAAVLIGFCVHPLLGQDATVDVAEKCATICQPTDAPWRSIPWQIDLLEAQRLAVEQSRPLLIWAMDGHPLGCT